MVHDILSQIPQLRSLRLFARSEAKRPVLIWLIMENVDQFVYPDTVISTDSSTELYDILIVLDLLLHFGVFIWENHMENDGQCYWKDPSLR